jgi:hypothetical protein
MLHPESWQADSGRGALPMTGECEARHQTSTGADLPGRVGHELGGCLGRSNVEGAVDEAAGSLCLPGFAFQLTALIRVAGPGGVVRTWAMWNVPALIATVDQVAGVATVTVRGEFSPSAYSRLRDRLVWVAENCPRRLVLDLGVADRFTEQLITLIADARRQLPVGCLLEIRSASAAMRDLLELAGWPGVRVTSARPEAEFARGGQGPA